MQTVGTTFSPLPSASIKAHPGNPNPQAFELAATKTSRTDPAGPGVVGTTDWSVARPAAVVLGATTGPGLPAWMGGSGGFALVPLDNPLSPSLFASKAIKAGAHRGNVFNAGAVGTYNPATGAAEVGFGGVYRVKLNAKSNAGLPDVAVFANARTDSEALKINKAIEGKADGTFSINFGVVFSLDQAVSGIAKGAGKGAALLPHPASKAAGALVQTAGGAVAAAGKFGTAWAGVGYRGEVRIRQGEVEGIYLNGRKVDTDAMAESVLTMPEPVTKVLDKAGAYANDAWASLGAMFD